MVNLLFNKENVLFRSYFLSLILVFPAICHTQPAIDVASPSGMLERADQLLLADDYERVLSILPHKYNQPAHEKHRLILRGLARVYLEQWDKAKTEWNDLLLYVIENNTNNNLLQIPFILPPWLEKNGKEYKDFVRKKFNRDDMRYLWRTLWQARIASRFTVNSNDTFDNALQILDFVVRHVQFGTPQEDQFRDHPFYVLIRGQGMCEELAWILDGLLHSAEIEALRLVLRDPGKSPHTLSLVKIDDKWIPFDPSFALILKSSDTKKTEQFPQNFVFNPSEELLQKFGSEKKPLEPFIQQVKNLGIYSNLAETFRSAQPNLDYEREAHTARFLLLNRVVQDFVQLPPLAKQLSILAIPLTQPESRKIEKWGMVHLPYLYRMTSDANEVRRQVEEKLFGDLNPLRQARLALLDGEYKSAEKRFQRLALQENLSSRAKENVEYYLAVISFECGQYKQAEKQFHEFLENYPESGWKNRIYYQLARISHSFENQPLCQEYLTKCEQNHPASLFSWMEERKLLQNPTLKK